MSLAGRRIDPVLILILLVALVVRVRLGATREYIHDEINTAIPLSKDDLVRARPSEPPVARRKSSGAAGVCRQGQQHGVRHIASGIPRNAHPARAADHRRGVRHDASMVRSGTGAVGSGVDGVQSSTT
jgi:hypothetical protein